jgi:hypothetical protein
MKVFFIYLCLLCGLLIPVIFFKYVYISNVYRLLFLRFFLIMEFSALSLIFYYTIKQNTLRKIIFIIPFIFSAFSIYDYILSDKDKFSYIPLAGECLILLIYIIYFFYEKIQISTNIPIYQTNMFWIAVAFTLYCSGNFFLFLYSNNAIKNEQYFFQYTLIYSTFTIIKNTLLCIGIMTKQPIENPLKNDFLTQHNFPDLLNQKENI